MVSPDGPDGLAHDFSRLATSCRDEGRIGRIIQCIQGVQKDIEFVDKQVKA